jgi:TM2 domain-containing membrane protein YozV
MTIEGLFYLALAAIFWVFERIWTNLNKFYETLGLGNIIIIALLWLIAYAISVMNDNLGEKLDLINENLETINANTERPTFDEE